MPELGSSTRIERVFGRAWAYRAAPILAALIALFTIPIGFYSDDWSQIVHLQHRQGLYAPAWDIYRFADGVPAHLAEQMAHGPVPWFTDPHLKLAFLRPLSSLLFALDLKIFGVHPLGWHLHSIAWYVALVLLARALFRRVVPGSPAIANLAACIYAIDGAHIEPVGWLACRHMLVAGVPALSALLLHISAREGRFRAGKWLAPIAFTIGLGGSEAGLGIVGYLIAYELFGPPRDSGESLARRARSLLPYAMLLAIYAVIYKTLGYGAGANGGYIDPATDPLRYVGAIFDRLPILLANLGWVVPADFGNLVPHPPLWIAGGLALLVFGALLRAIWPVLPNEERTALRWLLPGALVALVASLGGYPGARVLVLPSLASAVLFATIVIRGASTSARGLARIGVATGRYVAIAFHLGFAALIFLVEANGVAEMSRKMLDLAASTDFGSDVASSHAIVLSASDPYSAFYLPAPLLATGQPVPESWQVISMAKTTHRITRVSDRVIRLRMLDAPMLQGSFEKVLRSPSNPFKVGDRAELEGLVITVIEVDQGAPRELELTTNVSLDDPTVRLLAFRDQKLSRVRLDVGSSIEVPWSPGPTGLF